MEYTRKLLLIVCLAGLLTLPWLDRAFYSRGEPREALVAQSMVATGNWVSPPAYDGAVPSKPPFSHWLMAIASQPRGEVTESSARLPSALAAMLFSAGFFLFLSRRVSGDVALGASLLLLTFPEWFRAASTCRVDMLLATSFAGSLLALFAWYERGQRGIPVVAIALLCAATLTKGPIGVVLPLAIFSLFWWSERGFAWRAIPRIAIGGILIALPVLAVSSLWYVAAYMERGDEFLAKVWYENFDRLSGSMHDEPHNHSAFYLLGVLALGLLPWSLLWIVEGARSARGGMRACARNLLTQYGLMPSLGRFALLAVVSIVLFFCIPSSKRGVYLLPAYPFIAVVAAYGVTEWVRRYERVLSVLCAVLAYVAMLVVATTIVAVAIGVLVPPFGQVVEFADAFLVTLSATKATLLLLLSGGVWFAIRTSAERGEASPVFEKFSLSLVAVVALVSACVADPLMLSLSPKRWIASGALPVSAEERERQAPFYSFGSEAYASSFYLQKPFKRALGPLPAGSIVFVQRRDVERFLREIAPGSTELGEHRSAFEASKKALVVLRTPMQ